jgi:hypothetical protein
MWIEFPKAAVFYVSISCSGFWYFVVGFVKLEAQVRPAFFGVRKYDVKASHPRINESPAYLWGGAV